MTDDSVRSTQVVTGKVMIHRIESILVNVDISLAVSMLFSALCRARQGMALRTGNHVNVELGSNRFQFRYLIKIT